MHLRALRLAGLGGGAVSNADRQDHFTRILGRRITASRVARGLTKDVVADVVGVAQVTVAHIEAGRITGSQFKLIQLLGMLEVKVPPLAQRFLPIACCEGELLGLEGEHSADCEREEVSCRNCPTCGSSMIA